MDDDDGTIPRVSELSTRIELDRLMDKSRKRLNLAAES